MCTQEPFTNLRAGLDSSEAPFADSVTHGCAGEVYLKCDWCGAPASFWIRRKNYCRDCLAVRLPENKPEKNWWPAVQQVGTTAELSPTRALASELQRAVRSVE